MDIRTTYSNYLKSADLGGHEPTVTITSCEMESMPGGDETKPVLKFYGKDKGLVLNKTNSEMIADAYGYDTTAWVGKIVTLFSIKVNFQGNMVDGLRVRIPAAQPQAAPAAPSQSAPPAEDDEIPF